MSALALPDPHELAIDRAVEMARSAEAWAESVDDVGELLDAHDQLAAMTTYLRKRAEAASVEFARADRRVEVRIGVVIGPAKVGGARHHNEGTSIAIDVLSKAQRQHFRSMAAHRDDPTVLAAIEAGASRRAVLRACAAITQPREDTAITRPTYYPAAQLEAEIRKGAEANLSAHQIAEQLGIKHSSYVRERARQFGIEIPADAVVTRRRRIDSNHVVEQTVIGVEIPDSTFDRIEFAALDGDRLTEWIDLLGQSIRTLSQLRTRLRNERSTR